MSGVGIFLRNAVDVAARKVKGNSPAILTGLTLLGVGATAVTSFIAGYSSHDIIVDKKEKLARIPKEDKSARRDVYIEGAKELAPKIVPTILVASGTTAAAVSSNFISSRRIEAATTVASMATKSLEDINDEVTEQLGKNKAKKIRDGAIKRRLERERPNNGNEMVYIEDLGGSVRCIELIGGRRFYLSHEDIQRALDSLAYKCDDERYVTWNDFYMLIGIDTVEMGDIIYFTNEDLRHRVDNFGNPDIPALPIEITTIMDFDDKPCISIRPTEYRIAKNYEYE